MVRWLLPIAMFVSVSPAVRADGLAYDRTQDVIYGRKYGVCLTMDVLTPKLKPNGAAIIVVVSGGWESKHDHIDGILKIGLGNEFLKRGYTLFAVVHGSQPKFNITEAIADMHRAVRFIRFHAKDYQIDPDRIGISGASAGCHLSLMIGVSGNDAAVKPQDEVDRVSSRVQAVAGFFPPTDFFNYGSDGKNAEAVSKSGRYAPAFDFRERSGTNNWVPVPDERRKEILKDISPIYHVTPQTPPTLLVHGDLDFLVPIQQSKIMIEKLKENKVPCELIVRKGGSHGWFGIDKDVVPMADWFDKYMPKKK
jgi:acetyl esterase/lipase